MESLAIVIHPPSASFADAKSRHSQIDRPNLPSTLGNLVDPHQTESLGHAKLITVQTPLTTSRPGRITSNKLLQFTPAPVS
jgi:hypothetical protein